MSSSSQISSSESTQSWARNAPGPRGVCYCERPTVVRLAQTKENFGRRFISCENWKIGRECGFFDWVDPEPCDHGKVILNLLKQKHDHLVAEVKRCQRMVEIEVGKVKSEMDKEIAKITSELEKEGQQLKSVMADEIAGYRKEIEIGQIKFHATKKNYETMLVCSWVILGLCLCIIWFRFSSKPLHESTVGRMKLA